MALPAIAGVLSLGRLPQSKRIAIRILDRRVLVTLATGVEQLLQTRFDVADLPVRNWSAMACIGIEADLQVTGPEAA